MPDFSYLFADTRIGRMLSPATLRTLLNVVLFQVGWIGCLLLDGLQVLVLTLSILALHQLIVVQQRREWLLIAAVTLAGGAGDAVLQQFAILNFPDATPFIPLWLVCLWLLFASTLSHALSWLQTRLYLASAMGAVAGPFSYYAGAQLSPAFLGQPLALSLLCLGVFWAVFFPLSLVFAAKLMEK